VSLANDIRTPEEARRKIVLERPELPQVSLANDMRTPELGRGKIVLERPEPRRLELVFKLRPHAGSDLDALVPAAEDMVRTVILANGTPGGIAVIHLDTRATELRRAGGTKIVGFFDEHGRFSVVLPASLDARGIFARGEELVRMAHGGRAVPASKRPVSDNMDVEETISQAYFNWLRYYVETNTNLQFRTGGKMRAARLDDADASDSTASQSSGSLSRGVGHTQRGSGVDDDTQSGGGDEEGEVVIDPANPLGGRGALGKIPLQRPARRSPVIGGGHTLPGSGVDDDTQSGGGADEGTEVSVDPADPVGAARAFGKIKLQRPAPAPTPTQRDDHVLQRKL